MLREHASYSYTVCYILDFYVGYISQILMGNSWMENSLAWGKVKIGVQNSRRKGMTYYFEIFI